MNQTFENLITDDYENVSELSLLLREKTKRENRLDVLRLVNTSDFIQICCIDLQIMINLLCDRPSAARASLYARIDSLIIVELLEDVPYLLGKNFQNTVATITSEEDFKRFRAITKSLSQLRKTHDQDLRHIRNIAIAHREHDVETQLELMTAIDFDNVVRLATDIVKWHASYIHFHVHLLNKLVEKLNVKRNEAKTEQLGRGDGYTPHLTFVVPVNFEQEALDEPAGEPCAGDGYSAGRSRKRPGFGSRRRWKGWFRGSRSGGSLIDKDFGDRLRNTSHFQERRNRYGR